jgi:centromeric protein E
MELQEERKSRKECDQCIREQQIKIVNHSNLVTSSEFNMNSSQVLLMQSNGYDIYIYTDIF